MSEGEPIFAQLATERGRPAITCPCLELDLATELATQHALMRAAVTGDQAALFALYDAHLHRTVGYLAGWVGDPAVAEQLTCQVVWMAQGELPAIASSGTDLAAELIALAADLVRRERAAGLGARADAGRQGGGAVAHPVLARLPSLADRERGVVIVRFLLGHSLLHTAHLLGETPAAVADLQLAACSKLLAGLDGQLAAGLGGAIELDATRAHTFERALAAPAVDLLHTDPDLAGMLSVAYALRAVAPRLLPRPGAAFAARVHDLLAGRTPAPTEPPAPTGARPAIAAGAGPAVAGSTVPARAGTAIAAGAGFAAPAGAGTEAGTGPSDPMAWIDEPTDRPPDVPTPSRAARARRRRRWSRSMLVLAAACVAFAVGGWSLTSRQSSCGTACPAAAGSGPTGAAATGHDLQPTLPLGTGLALGSPATSSTVRQPTTTGAALAARPTGAPTMAPAPTVPRTTGPPSTSPNTTVPATTGPTTTAPTTTTATTTTLGTSTTATTTSTTTTTTATTTTTSTAPTTTT